jgi:chitin disaccharide deacetylase
MAFVEPDLRVPLAERLGYGPRARLLIVHADDLGLSKGVNDAFFAGLALGRINSGSAMVPCGDFDDVAAFARLHPDADIGLHLTLTSGPFARPWGPVAPPAQVPSLVDGQGHFHVKWTSNIPIMPGEVEIELRAQIDKAYASGLNPTHLDSHQFLLQMKDARLFEVYLRLSRAYGLPVLVSRDWFRAFPYIEALLSGNDIVLDRIATIAGPMPPEQWPGFYRGKIKGLPPGISEILVHPGFDGPDLQTFFQGRREWGAAWRQRDFDFFSSDEFPSLLEEEDIQLITWREIVTRLQAAH